MQLPIFQNPSEHCQGCPGQLYGLKRVMPDGDGSSGIMLIGESPWVDEVRDGRPFSGASGYFLNRVLGRLGINRQTLTITNSMWCKAPRLGYYDKPNYEASQAITQCRPHLDDLIHQRKPKAIVTLGAVAMQRVLGDHGLDIHQGYLHDSDYGVPVVPSYHPSFLMQGNQKLTICLMYSLRLAQDIAKGAHKRSQPRYILDDYPAMRAYLEEPC